jgi:hypothetical protein
MSVPGINLDPAKYAEMTVTPPEVIEDIALAAHSAYVTASESIGGRGHDLAYEDVKKFGACMLTSDHITRFLGELPKNYEAGFLTVYFPTNSFHVLSTVKAANLPLKGIIVDATWQQFLPRRPRLARIKDGLRDLSYPDVLIGTEAEVAKVALSFGFSKEQAATWGPVNG